MQTVIQIQKATARLSQAGYSMARWHIPRWRTAEVKYRLISQITRPIKQLMPTCCHVKVVQKFIQFLLVASRFLARNATQIHAAGEGSVFPQACNRPPKNRGTRMPLSRAVPDTRPLEDFCLRSPNFLKEESHLASDFPIPAPCRLPKDVRSHLLQETLVTSKGSPELRLGRKPGHGIH